jgi:hypothetical protein
MGKVWPLNKEKGIQKNQSKAISSIPRGGLAPARAAFYLFPKARIRGRKMRKTWAGSKITLFLAGLGSGLCFASLLKTQSFASEFLDPPLLFPVPILQQKEEEKPFTPHWSGQVEFNHLSRQETGHVQSQDEMTLTALYHFTESGHYAAIGAGGGVQALEGGLSAFGELNLEGGLGLGAFQPSLGLQIQRGSQSLSALTSTLSLDFEVSDVLTLGPVFWIGTFGYQGSAGVDSGRRGLAFKMDFTPLDFLAFSAQVSRETDEYYGASTPATPGLARPNPAGTNPADTVSALSLGIGITLFGKLGLEATGQAGIEDLPAGTVYSPVLGGTVTSTNVSSRFFTGYAFALTYDF